MNESTFFTKLDLSAGQFNIFEPLKAAGIKNFNSRAGKGFVFFTCEDGDEAAFLKTPGMSKWHGPVLLRYDFNSATKAGITEHPQHITEQLGFEVVNYEGVPISDCAIIEVVGNMDGIKLPAWIKVFDKPFIFYKEEQ